MHEVPYSIRFRSSQSDGEFSFRLRPKYGYQRHKLNAPIRQLAGIIATLFGNYQAFILDRTRAKVLQSCVQPLRLDDAILRIVIVLRDVCSATHVRQRRARPICYWPSATNNASSGLHVRRVARSASHAWTSPSTQPTA